MPNTSAFLAVPFSAWMPDSSAFLAVSFVK